MQRSVFRELIESRGITQSDLAKRAGLAQSYISKLVSGKYNNIGMNNFEKIAHALSMTPEQLRRNLKGENIPQRYKPSFNEQLELVRLSAPIDLPVYDSVYFHAGRGEAMNPVDSIPLTREFVSNRKLEAYLVSGTCLSPIIMDKDIVVVDPDAPIDIGCYVACQHGESFEVGKIKSIGGETLIENGQGHFSAYDCAKVARIVKITRNL